ncbi:MAG: BON domain-containing protein [Gammaproteobacteria bacterium]
MRNKAAPLACLAVSVALAAVAGCSFSATPGKGGSAEWIGTYQKQQAAAKDQDRATALRVRSALANDPVLNPLGLRIFVHSGSVTLCGGFPNAKARERATAVVGQVKGVIDVNTRCGH